MQNTCSKTYLNKKKNVTYSWLFVKTKSFTKKHKVEKNKSYRIKYWIACIFIFENIEWLFPKMNADTFGDIGCLLFTVKIITPYDTDCII